ncbi:hypothetical protein CONCODRAFT_11793 [Conidiobolus coronatus NRRL 28638]|uniref:F-box domain-containing protein n=1 Tax=Conidiobolus coronatus (strain ATCC 28846 / CBS 209.66 / NRRL 28638) TaxID=796925 RepID=A0A137NUD9_CONC2|nr:hypothetical protein CONCODRAFT_11793 [Conidiobolus coronatus NRRL 28638]|eukprot:KXN66379.1 hypothetical protein CONCODRAFT_11793 [Conidiobolus coronatus NRRL 28638]
MSMITDKRAKKFIEVKNENIQQSSVWDISSILLNIFAYTGRKDLIKLSTVCRKWYNLANPIIHKSIKLTRRRYNINAIHANTRKEAALTDAEVAKCIYHNAKHAHLVKKFKYYYVLEPRRAIEVFETFRFICNLTIERCNVSQYQFLRMISPLTQLQELTLSEFGIKMVIKERAYNEAAVQLPLCLKILRLENIILADNQKLFIQTINSHRNLIEFSTCSTASNEFLEPFYRHYPSLLSFEFNNLRLQTSQSLFTVLENNPQLISLKLSLGDWRSELVNHINSCMINLEELKLCEIICNDMNFFAKFTQPTKIKKLNLEWVGFKLLYQFAT